MARSNREELTDRFVDAGRTGNLNLMMAAHKQGVDINALDETTTGALHNVIGACQNDSLRQDSAPAKLIVTWLLENGADVNLRDGLLRTPLHYAAARGDRQLVSQLLAAGADVRAEDVENLTPLDKAANATIAQMLADDSKEAAQECRAKGFTKRLEDARQSNEPLKPSR